MNSLLGLAIGFIAGSIPFGYLLVRLAGRGDVREVGSGNIGATNVGRILGPAGWVATLAADAGKGTAGVVVASWLVAASPEVAAATAVGAVLGHCYTPWLGGRGGKGVATMLGAFAVLTPASVMAAIAAFALAALASRTVSLGSLVAVAALAATAWLLDAPLATVFAAVVAAAIVALRHRENIARMVSGDETRIGRSAR